MIKIALDLRCITPAFLGGAGPAAELRPPSIKGQLRFWLRAVDPSFRTRESELFGGAGAGAGQSRVLLRVHGGEPKYVRWEAQRAQSFTKGSGTHSTNGLVYLGYPFQLKGNEDRTALAPQSRFTLLCVLPRPLRKQHEVQDRRALLAALWAFATLGSLGMRSRRGFGSLALTSWKPEAAAADERAWREDMASLPLLHDSPDMRTWNDGIAAGLRTIRQWLGEFRSPQKHPYLGPASAWRLSPESQRDAKNWQAALAHAGLQLQTFRQRMQPDYTKVKDHLRFEARDGGARLKAAPERAAFGLPLAFRYSSLRVRVKPAVFVPTGGRTLNGKPPERHPSPLLLKLVELPDGLHSLWLRLDGPRPGSEPRATLRGSREPLIAPARDLVGDFLANPDARMER